MSKPHARILARELRIAGHSYNYIAACLDVSKGTLAVWLADIVYVPNAETVDRIGKARAASGEAKSKLKRDSFAKAKLEARVEMGDVSERDLFMLGLGLYIGEGAKSTTMTRFANSNASIISLIISWFEEALNIPKSHVRIRLHIYPDSDYDTCLRFWSKSTGISTRQFQRPVIDSRKDKKSSKAGKLPYGTAHVGINSLGDKRFGVFLARKIAAWSELVLSKKAGLV